VSQIEADIVDGRKALLFSTEGTLGSRKGFGQILD
jgi:hypothetical protein